jgi:hypothetical protein
VRARSLSLVVVALLADRVHAAPPTTLKMRVFESQNLHIANDGGASHWTDDATVIVELRADGTLAASTTGTRTDHQLYVTGASSYNTDDVTKWKTTWTGTHKRDGAALVLALAVAAETCTRAKTSDGVPPEQLACRAVAKRTTLRCTSARVTLEDLDANKKQDVDAWRCAPTNADDLGESPPWLLGKTECISVGGGRMSPTSYHPCKP